MKKTIFLLLAVALCGSMFVACDKEGEDLQEEQLKVRIATFADDWDTWTYTYDGTGKLTNVFREESKQWNFAYDGTTITITGRDSMVLTLGSNGFVSQMSDEWGDVRTYTYDAKGHLTQIKKNGTVVSNLTITDGCIVNWSKWTMKGTDTENVEHFKNHTFSTVKNVAGMHNIYSEMFGSSRWLMETGLFGIASDYLCESVVWDYSTSAADLTYEFDANNCVTKEIKTGTDYVENYHYTWTVIE